MTLTKKISLLCMSILTLNFMNSDVYSMNNYNKKSNYVNYNYDYNVLRKNDYNSMLDLYKFKEDKQNNNNDLDLDYNFLGYDNDFLLELKEIVNKISNEHTKQQFVDKVKKILNKLGINETIVENVLQNNDVEESQFQDISEKKGLNSLSNAILNDFLNGTKLNSKLMINTIMTIAKTQNNFAKFIMKCIILDLDVNKKFDLLWSMCNKCDYYASGKKLQDYNTINKLEYLMRLVPTLSCMVSYDVNEQSNQSNDEIVAKLVPLMISYYKSNNASNENDIKETINNNLLQYIKSMNGKNNDKLLGAKPETSFLLFIRDNILLQNSNEKDIEYNDCYDNKSVVSSFDFNNNGYYEENKTDDEEEYKKDEFILSDLLSTKIEKLRNMVIVNNAILNGQKTFNQRIPSFSNNENNTITSDNMVFFVKHLRNLLQKNENIKQTLNNTKQKDLYAILGINGNKNSGNSIVNVINLALTPNKNVHGINIGFLQELFIENAPDDMKIFSNTEKCKLFNIKTSSLKADLLALFNCNNEVVEFNLQRLIINNNNQDNNSFVNLIYQTLKNLQCDNKYVITNETRREIINSGLLELFNSVDSNIISEFTKSLSCEECNAIITYLFFFNTLIR